MPKYYAKSPVMHDGTLYAPGTPISLTDAEARPLIAAGAAMTEEEAKQAAVQKEAVDSQAATISQKDAEIARLRAELEAAKSGTVPADAKKA